MLITLVSNNDADATNFSNFFKQTVQLHPHSKIALVSAQLNIEDSTDVIIDKTILVNIDQFQVGSICKTGGFQSSIGVVPWGENSVGAGADDIPLAGLFFFEPKNLIYHDLGNTEIINHNELSIRLTDSEGNSISPDNTPALKHPTVITVDIRV